MFGIIFGLTCLYLFYRLNRYGGFGRRGRCAHEGGHHGHHPGRGFRGRFMRRVLRKIDATPEQATEIEDAFDELRAEVLPLRSIMRGTKTELAAAIREEELGDERIDAAFALHRDALDTAHKAVKRAIERLHAVLEPSQRALVADHFARFSARQVGPYR